MIWPLSGGDKGVAVLVGLGVVLVALAGCAEPPDWFKPSRYHSVIVHPPHYEWDDEHNVLTGHFMLSNMHPETEDGSKTARMQSLFMNAFFETTGSNGGGSWSLGYNNPIVYIGPGETYVFNFTFPKEYGNRRADVITGDVNWISVRIGASYGYCCEESWVTERNTNGSVYVSSSYTNNCIAVRDGVIQQRSSGNCDSWGWPTFRPPDGEKSNAFSTRIGELYWPPPEVWLDWDDDKTPPLSEYPQFKPRIEFLRGFDYGEADIVYFERKIREGIQGPAR